jgi:hypothetical protein
MKYRIPLGIQIAPFSTNTGKMGPPKLTTIKAEFQNSDILKRIPMKKDDVEAEYFCLPLGPNPSEFDSYLVCATDTEPVAG